MLSQVKIKEKAFESAVIRKNLTYKELAKRLGITKVYLSNLKSDKAPMYCPSGTLRKKILKELDVSFDKIFEIKDIRNNEKTRKLRARRRGTNRKLLTLRKKIKKTPKRLKQRIDPEVSDA